VVGDEIAVSLAPVVEKIGITRESTESARLPTDDVIFGLSERSGFGNPLIVVGVDISYSPPR
jgi:hypothetical protein